jgi:aryl-alcohol dehydrogenase-like predicted oxidoreductase
MKIGNFNFDETMVKQNVIALGTMYFGSKTDTETSCSILDNFYDYGGTVLDSANKYASWIKGCRGGESEYVIGKWLKDRKLRNEMFVSSKVGFAYGTVPRSLKKEIIISECEKSLRRMQIETIDLYFAHTFDVETPVEETMEAFYHLKKAGKIRFAGASNMYSWQLLDYNCVAKKQGWDGFMYLQQRHSFLQPTLDADFGTQIVLTKEMVELCSLNKINLMAYSPLLSGFYSDSTKKISPYYESKSSEIKLKAVNFIANELKVSPNAVVLAWMLQSSPVIIPIVACSSVMQLYENMQVLNFRLTDKQLKVLNQQVEIPLGYS